MYANVHFSHQKIVLVFASPFDFNWCCLCRIVPVWCCSRFRVFKVFEFMFVSELIEFFAELFETFFS